MNNNKIFTRVFDRGDIGRQEKINQERVRQSRGRMLWEQLHKQAYNHDGSNDNAFITNFGKQIPRFLTGCPCNEFWNKWIKENPPKYDRGEYF